MIVLDELIDELLLSKKNIFCSGNITTMKKKKKKKKAKKENDKIKEIYEEKVNQFRFVVLTHDFFFAFFCLFSNTIFFILNYS